FFCLVLGEVPVGLHRHVGGADNLAPADELLHAVGAPAGNAGNGENGGVQLHGQIQHTVDKAAVEVHVGGNALVDFPLLGDELGGQALHIGVQLVLVGAALFFGKPLHKPGHNLGAGVGEGVHRVAHAVDEAGLGKGHAVRSEEHTSEL